VFRSFETRHLGTSFSTGTSFSKEDVFLERIFFYFLWKRKNTGFYLWPSNFPETSCMALMQAQAADAVTVTGAESGAGGPGGGWSCCYACAESGVLCCWRVRGASCRWGCAQGANRKRRSGCAECRPSRSGDDWMDKSESCVGRCRRQLAALTQFLTVFSQGEDTELSFS
jgi:hypothetical protein